MVPRVHDTHATRTSSSYPYTHATRTRVSLGSIPVYMRVARKALRTVRREFDVSHIVQVDRSQNAKQWDCTSGEQADLGVS